VVTVRLFPATEAMVPSATTVASVGAAATGNAPAQITTAMSDVTAIIARRPVRLIISRTIPSSFGVESVVFSVLLAAAVSCPRQRQPFATPR
jgi:hypothetical protein